MDYALIRQTISDLREQADALKDEVNKAQQDMYKQTPGTLAYRQQLNELIDLRHRWLFKLNELHEAIALLGKALKDDTKGKK